MKSTDWLKDRSVLVDTLEALKEMVVELLACPVAAYDVESTGLRIHDDSLVSMQFCGNHDKAYFVPIALPWANNLPLHEVITICRPVFDRGLIGHNIKYDWEMTQKYIDFDIIADTLIEAKLIPELWEKYENSWDLKTLIEGEFGFPVIAWNSLFPPKFLKKNQRFDIVVKELAVPYGCQDVIGALMLYELFTSKFALDRTHLIYKLEHAVIKPTARMELTGIRIDVDNLKTAEEAARLQLDHAQAEVNKMAGREILLTSPAQVSKLLFDDLGLTSVGETKSGKASSDKKSLEKLKGKHPIIEHIILYRNISKLIDGFIGKLPLFVQGDGNVHASLNQFGAITGRYSCSEPNLQTIPKEREKDGDEFRKALRSSFLPPNGYIGLIDCDFSQLEYRWIACLANDTELMDGFRNEIDFHVKTASLMFGVPVDQVSKQERSKGKTINFGVIFGLSDKALAEALGITLRETQDLLSQYWQAVPKVKRYIETMKKRARNKGYCETYFGRRRMLPDINSRNYGLRGYSERCAVNGPVQGSAADLVKLAIVRCDNVLKNFKSKMILQVHDQLVFAHHEDDNLLDLCQAIKQAMEVVIPNFVPMTIDMGYGPNWWDIEARRIPTGESNVQAVEETIIPVLVAPVREISTPPTNEKIEVRPVPAEVPLASVAYRPKESIHEGDFIQISGQINKDVERILSTMVALNPGESSVYLMRGEKRKLLGTIRVDQRLLFNLKKLGVQYDFGDFTKKQIRQLVGSA